MGRPEQGSPLSWVMWAAAASLSFLVAGCRSQPQHAETTAPPVAQTPPVEAPQTETKHYDMKGKVVALDLGEKKLTVDHENIPGFMGAMTMPYQVKGAALLENLAPGVQITATVVSSGAQYWLEDVKAAPQHPGQAPGEPHADHMERRFDNAEQWAKSFDDPARDAWQMPARVIGALGLAPGQIVADIGAGTGYFTIPLARSPASPKVYAVDIEASMVDYVRQRATKEGVKNVVAVQAGTDATNLPEPVDLALIVDTYHHLPTRVAYFTALRTLMKPGGRLAIVDFRKGVPGGPPDEFRFTPAQISAELTQAGFVLQTEHEFLPRQIFLVYGMK